MGRIRVGTGHCGQYGPMGSRVGGSMGLMGVGWGIMGFGTGIIPPAASSFRTLLI